MSPLFSFWDCQLKKYIVLLKQIRQEKYAIFDLKIGIYNSGFPDSSVGKESAYKTGDPGSIPRLGRSAGEEIGYPLQYSRASLVTQLVKNSPAMREAWVQSLVWEDTLEKGTATHSSILVWRIPVSQTVGHD